MKTRIAALLVLLLGTTQTTTAQAAAWEPPVTTVAGGNGPGAGIEDLDTPYGLTIGPDNSLYIADQQNHRVLKVSLDDEGNSTETTTVAGGTGSGSLASSLSYPRDVALSPTGMLFISDGSNHRIQMIATRADGSFAQAVTVAGGMGQGSGTDQLDYPYGITFDASGALYIADSGNDRVQRITFDADGNRETTTTIAGGNGEGGNINQLHSPRAVALDADGAVYIADWGNSRVQKVTIRTDGTASVARTIVGGNGFGSDQNQLASPYALAFDSSGTLYIADSSNHRIQRVTFDQTGIPGAASTIFGNGQGSDMNQLDNTRGLAVDINDSLYISDPNNHRVQRVDLDTMAPVIDITDTGTVRIGDTATLNYSCSDTGGSQISSCAATLLGQPISSGTAITTTTRGSRSMTFTATDNAGNTTTHTTSSMVYGKRELAGTYSQASEASGSIARLYMATFTRDPDTEGFKYWTDENKKVDLQAAADYFASSPEFEFLYGTRDNPEFVDLIYQNVLVRTVEPAGRYYWLDQLDNGMTQAQMLLWFSESPEFKVLTYTS